jgi:hypothetical protein
MPSARTLANRDHPNDIPVPVHHGREVNSERKRAQAEHVASSVPNVEQVVNELQVKDQKATSR